MSAHQTPLFELGFPRSARLLHFLSIAVDSIFIMANCEPWLCFDRKYVNQGPPCGLTVALKVSSCSPTRISSSLLCKTEKCTTDLRRTRVRETGGRAEGREGFFKDQLSRSGLWVRFVRLAWWQTMPSCPVPLDPGPRAKDHPRAERALRDGRLSSVGTGRQQRHVCDKGVKGKVQLAPVFFPRSLACRGTLKPSLLFFGEGGNV